MLGTFASTSCLVFMAQCFRLRGSVVHPLIGRYVLSAELGLMHIKIKE